MSTRSRGSASSPRAGGRNAASAGAPASKGSASSPRARSGHQASVGTPATGRSANPGTQVSSLNRQESTDEYARQRMYLDVAQRELNQSAAYQERLDKNIYAPYQQRNLASEERKTDRNASSQEKIAALQAQASMFGSAEQTKQSKQQAEAQKHAASASASATKDAARSQADAQKFAANVDAAARQFDTKTKGRTEFSGLLANLAASVGNRSGQSMSDIFNAATQAAGVASQNKDSDKDRMADMYKSIMATYNTGSGQFKYW